MSTRCLWSIIRRSHCRYYSRSNALNVSPVLLAPPQYQDCNGNKTHVCSNSTRFSSNLRSSKQRSNHNNFLTPGFQPTAISGDNTGFYQGSTFYDGAPPNVLPILNASPVLSPGKYVKQSSWAESHHQNNNRKGTKSGAQAALRLVDARREFTHLMHTELLGLQQKSTSEVKAANDVRKIYALKGHGVPPGLLTHLIQVMRGWTTPQSTRQQYSSSVAQLSFQNAHNLTLLDRHEIQVIHTNGSTSKMTDMNSNQILNNNVDWEQDFELFMVVMDRIASRLASFALTPHSQSNHYHDISATVDNEVFSDKATLGSSGSVITPASLKNWNVTMMRGDALPLSLLPLGRHERQSKSSTILTVEWVLPKQTKDCCKIILRLQDDGSQAMADLDEEKGRGPMSLVFEGEYE